MCIQQARRGRNAAFVAAEVALGDHSLGKCQSLMSELRGGDLLPGC